jgi:hypothetical protein
VPRPFQGGYLGEQPDARRGGERTVTPVAWADLGNARPAATAEAAAPAAPRAAARAGGPADLDLVVAAVEEAARHARTATRLP